MRVEFRLPDLGEGVTEGEVASWKVAPGDTVTEDQPLLEVVTDKVEVEIPSPVSGTVLEIAVTEGTVARVGQVLIVLESDRALPVRGVVAHEGRPAPTSPAERKWVGTAPPDGARALIPAALPATRALAAELGVALATVTGSGGGGRITDEDVRTAAAAPQATPLPRLRRLAAATLEASAAIPQVTVVEEADVTLLLARNRAPLPALLVAAARALHEFPELNAWLGSDRRSLVYHEDVHLGIAVDTGEGLVVPVLHDADKLSEAEIGARVADLASRARDGKLSPEEVRGATFTVTSIGREGGLVANPLLNPPEVGILGMHRIRLEPRYVGGALQPTRVVYLTLTFDHRAIDGLPACRFLATVVRNFIG